VPDADLQIVHGALRVLLRVGFCLLPLLGSLLLGRADLRAHAVFGLLGLSGLLRFGCAARGRSRTGPGKPAAADEKCNASQHGASHESEFTRLVCERKGSVDRGTMSDMPKGVTPAPRARETEPRVRRGYFECRYGQLHVHNAIPPGGGFEEGTPLLCLHGAGGTGRAFLGFLPHAGRDRSVYAPDLPGCGESDPPPPHAQLEDYAAALGEFLDSMRLRKLDVLGYRAGALLAAELTLLRTAQVRRLAMVSVPVAAAVAAAHAPSPGLAEAAAHYRWRERLGRLAAQQTLLVRPKDEFWDGSARVREVLPGARLAELPEHGADLLESGAPALARTVRDFTGD
jgi:pimeloyl-ACP methyl ester carboxylesterase